MSTINRKLYPDLDAAHRRIDQLDETIVHYESEASGLRDKLERISAIIEKEE